MTLYREEAGSFAIATGGESTYGAGDTVTHRFLIDPPDPGNEWDRYTKRGKATGKEYSTGGSVLRWTTGLTRGGDLCDKSLPILTALCFGGDTRSAVDTSSASQHLSVPPGPSVELLSTAIEEHLRFEGDTNGFTHVGVIPSNFWIEGSNDSGQWKWGATFATKGYPARAVTSSFSGLVQPSRCPFVWGQTFVKVATTVPSAAPNVSGAAELPTTSFDPDGAWTVTDWSANIMGVRWEWDSGGITRQTTGTTDGTASNAWRTQASETITLTHLLDETNAFSNLLSGGHTINEAGEQLAYGMVIANRQNSLAGSTYYHAFQKYFPRAELVSVGKARGNPRIFTSTWEVCDPSLTGVSPSYHYAYNVATEGDYF